MTASRRSFLAASAASAAGLAAGSLGPSRLPAAVRRGEPGVVRLALIGCGGQGPRDLEGMFRAAAAGDDGVPAVRCVAACDVDADRLAALRDRADGWNRDAGMGPGCRAFADFRELLNETAGELDAVIVATPDHQHAPPSVAAADAGLAVYCEKPLANSEADCDALLAAATRNNTVFQVGSHERSNPRVRRACELVRGGALGELERVILQMPTDQQHHADVKAVGPDTPLVPPPALLDYAAWLGGADGPAAWPDMKSVDPDLPDWMGNAGPHFWWRFVAAFGAGEITDRGAHILDIAQLATGRDDADDWRLASLKATGGGFPGAFYDSPMEFDFTLTFPSGPDYVGTTEGERGLTFEGERGTLFVAVHGGALTADPPGLLDATTDADLGRTPSHHAGFLAAIAGGPPVTAPARAGHRTAMLCLQINAALRGA